MQNALTQLWFPALFAAAVVGVLLSTLVLHRIKMDFPRVYSDIGSPSLFNSSIKNNWLFLKFLWKGDYRKLGNPSLTKLCILLQVYTVLYTILFFAPFLQADEFAKYLLQICHEPR